VKQRLSIHIGAIKTGSSAVQWFLKDNSERLRASGIVVPDQQLALTGPITGDHIPFFDARRDGQDDEYRSELTARVDALFRETGARQVVISAENLSEGDTRPAPWFSDLAARYETEVIVYLRRQDEVLLSAWQQWDAKVQPDFWAWIISRAGILADWQIVLERWEAVVGRECIRARLYERERLPDGDVVRDFEQVVKFDELGLSWTPNAMINARFSEVVVDLVTAGGFFTDIYDFDFYNFVTDMTGDSYYARSGDSQLTMEQRLAIVSRYGESNAWVREAYFRDGDTPESLFEMPRPGQYVVRSRDELRREQIQLVARLVFELARRSNP
jgi:hypothetical protein